MILKYIPGMHLRVADDIEEIGLDLDQFNDEVVGEWGLYDTQEGHERRGSSVIMHGVPVAAPASAVVETGSDMSQRQDEKEAK